MRAGIVVEVTPKDRRQLEAIVGDRNAPQKHVTRDKTRKPGKPPLPAASVQGLVDLALGPPPGRSSIRRYLPTRGLWGAVGPK
jgi:hypothetical protein